MKHALSTPDHNEPRTALGTRTGGRDDDRLVDIGEASDLLGLRRSTLYGWAFERRIPTVKMGRALRFRLSTIRKLIAQSERPARHELNAG